MDGHHSPPALAFSSRRTPSPSPCLVRSLTLVGCSLPLPKKFQGIYPACNVHENETGTTHSFDASTIRIANSKYDPRRLAPTGELPIHPRRLSGTYRALAAWQPGTGVSQSRALFPLPFMDLLTESQRVDRVDSGAFARHWLAKCGT
jgi:hypothetical protein